MNLRALLPSLLTCTSVVAAVVALSFLVVAPVTLGRDFAIALCVTMSLACDRFDGPLARRLGVTSEIGAQLDSLADAIAFGVVPALWVVGRAPPGVVVVVCAAVYVVAAVVRLARFHSVGLVQGRFGSSFVGMPTPAAAAFVVVTVSLTGRLDVRAVEALALLVLAAAMVSPVRWPKQGPGFVPFLLLVPGALFLLYGHT